MARKKTALPVGVWLPIETAPHVDSNDGPIVTDKGEAIWIHGMGYGPGWFDPHDDSDCGHSPLHPRWWIILPPVPET